MSPTSYQTAPSRDVIWTADFIISNRRQEIKNFFTFYHTLSFVKADFIFQNQKTPWILLFSIHRVFIYFVDLWTSFVLMIFFAKIFDEISLAFFLFQRYLIRNIKMFIKPSIRQKSFFMQPTQNNTRQNSHSFGK